MAGDRSPDFLLSQLHELCRLPAETEWVEFKENNAEPEAIGEYISALSNSAALVGKAFAYLVWGVRDSTHEIIGTNFSPRQARVGAEELENWLLRLLTPKIHFKFYVVPVEGKNVVLLEVERAMRTPVQFHGQEYIRVGSYKKKLKDFSSRERDLWRIFDQIPFESSAAAEQLTDSELVSLLDFTSYFDLVGRQIPDSRRSLMEALQAEKLVSSTSSGRWDVTNLGAVLFGKRLDDFGPLSRKAVRVVRYRGSSRIEAVREQSGGKGYATGFEGLITDVKNLLPSSEVVHAALRTETSAYPELAIRELVANALIHQDFSIAGAGPMIEIFDDRVEITNPGSPIVEAERFIDSPPRSRNETLASVMRRLGICEERGSGWDRIVFSTELYQLPAPLTEITSESTRVVLFAHRSLNRMSREDRVRALYLHACLRYVNREHMTNTTVRERFGIESHNIATASRLIREAVEALVIVPHDPEAAPRLRRYLPFWAAPDRA